MEARRPVRVRHPPPAGADRHQPAGPGQARGLGRARLLRRHLRPSQRRAADLGRVRSDGGHVRGSLKSRESITGLYRRAWAHSDATIDALPLDAIGHVPWWPPDRNEVTLHHVLVRVATETSRHAGHADIIRELIDGAVGQTANRPNLPPSDQAEWQAHHDRVERAAQEAARSSG